MLKEETQWSRCGMGGGEVLEHLGGLRVLSAEMLEDEGWS